MVPLLLGACLAAASLLLVKRSTTTPVLRRLATRLGRSPLLYLLAGGVLVQIVVAGRATSSGLGLGDLPRAGPSSRDRPVVPRCGWIRCLPASRPPVLPAAVRVDDRSDIAAVIVANVPPYLVTSLALFDVGRRLFGRHAAMPGVVLLTI